MRSTGLSTFLLALPVALSVACGGTETYEVEQTATAMVGSGTALDRISGDLGFAAFASIDLLQAAVLADANVTREQIETVHPTKVELAITVPQASQDLTFLDRVEFFVEASGQDKKSMAKGGPFEAATNPAQLAPETTLNLSSYVDGATMKITSDYAGRRPTNDTTIEARVTFTIQVQD